MPRIFIHLNTAIFKVLSVKSVMSLRCRTFNGVCRMLMVSNTCEKTNAETMKRPYSTLLDYETNNGGPMKKSQLNFAV